MVIIKLALEDPSGATVSDNVYWQGQRRSCPSTPELAAAATRCDSRSSAPRRKGGRIDITLENQGSAPALNAKITVLDAEGDRVLPAYYSDNYIA